jgi:replicative DNA helicase
LTHLYTMADTREAWRAWDQGSQTAAKVSFRGHWTSRAVGSFRPGSMLLVGARTNVGKTQFLLELARHADAASVVVSCEDAREEVGRRVAHWSPNELSRVQAAFPTYSKLEAVTQAIRDAHGAHGCKVAFVDYAQAVVVPGMTGMVAEAIRHLCHELKGLARDLGMVLVLASQVKRPEQGKGADSEPSLFDLRDGSSLENMADVVVLLHRVDDLTLKAKVAKSKWSRTGQEQLYTREADGRLVECAAPAVEEEDTWT